MNNIDKVIRFIKEIENLKSVTRTAWTKTGRRESTAEHSWRLAMLLMVLREDFKDLDIDKAIKMSLVHDLGELYDGDISAKLQNDNDNKAEMEEKAMRRMLTILPENLAENIYDLWKEYNECSTKEAKLVKAMDKLETIVQHNQGDNPDHILCRRFRHRRCRLRSAYTRTHWIPVHLHRHRYTELRLYRERQRR